MGSVADKIAKKVAPSRRSKVVDLASWNEGRKLARESNFGGEGPLPSEIAELGPCQGIYVLALDCVSCITAAISGLREARGFIRISSAAEEEYMPSGPPMSPLTLSYFTMWELFDLRFGSSRETMGGCVLRIAPEFDGPSWLTDTIALMQHSRMGFFVHCGKEEEGVLLREIGTGEIISCTVPSGYVGSAGEIWFARVLPPPLSSCDQHIVFITPYVIQDFPEQAFIDYVGRELERMKAQKRPPRTDDLHGHLMKYGPELHHWNEYIMCGYSGFQHEAVFLTGIPDIPESLPHS